MQVRDRRIDDNGGTLLVGDTAGNGKLGGVLHVTGGILGGTGDLGAASTAVTIAAGGIHAPGTSQAVLGDYVNQGTLRIVGNPAGMNKAVVAGGVDIAGATLDLVLSPANAANWAVFNGPFTIIDKQSAGAVTGTFGAVMQNLLFLDTLVAYNGGDGNDVTLTLNRNNTAFASVGRTRNQIATGAAIDALGDSNILWRAITLNGNPDSVRASFDALSGEIHASAKTALIEDSRLILEAVNGRLRQSFTAVGAPTMPVMSYAPDAGAASPAAQAMAYATIIKAPPRPTVAVWGKAFGSWGYNDSGGNAARLGRSSGGLMSGFDGVVAETWRVGMLGGYSLTTFDARNRASSGHSDSYHIGVYGGTQWGAFGLRTGVAYTWHDISVLRSVAFPGFSDQLRADYGAGTTQAFGELGYRIDAPTVSFEPFANLVYVNLRANSFNERGGAAALISFGANTDVTFTTLGVRASTDFTVGGIVATARGTLGWCHAFGDTTPLSSFAFAGGNVFTIAGVPIAQNAAIIDAGLDLAIAPSATIGVSYNGQFGGGALDQGVRGNLTVRF